MKTFRTAMLALLMAAFVVPAVAQDDPAYECKVKYQLFRNYQKDNNDEEAYNMLNYLLENCPTVAKGANLYIQGGNLLKRRLAAAKTPEERQRYVDEIMHLYDVRKEALKEPDALARKAKEMSELLGKQAVNQYYPLYAQAVAENGDKLEASWIYLYFMTSIDYVLAGHADSSMVVDNYDIASDLLDKELDEALEKGDTAAANLIRAQIALVENGFSPFADCDQLVAIYTKKFEADPNNVDLLKKITKILRKKGCLSTELFFNAARQLYTLEPTPMSAMMVGQMCYSKGQHAEAVTYFKYALPELTEKKDIYNCNFFLGLCYGEQRSWSAARSAFYDAAKADPSKGDPYLQIAILYAKSSSSISDDMNGHSAYWAAYDKAAKAKSVDPSCADNADKLMSSYRNGFPSQDKAFMLDLKDGNTFYVPGWIGESTTIRTRK